MSRRNHPLDVLACICRFGSLASRPAAAARTLAAWRSKRKSPRTSVHARPRTRSGLRAPSQVGLRRAAPSSRGSLLRGVRPAVRRFSACGRTPLRAAQRPRVRALSSCWRPRTHGFAASTCGLVACAGASTSCGQADATRARTRPHTCCKEVGVRATSQQGAITEQHHQAAWGKIAKHIYHPAIPPAVHINMFHITKSAPPRHAHHRPTAPRDSASSSIEKRKTLMRELAAPPGSRHSRQRSDAGQRYH